MAQFPMKDLFAAYDFHGHRLANRIVMAPMTRSRAADDGTPGPLMVEYYAQRSEAGLIISEGTNVSPQAQGFLNTPGIFSEAHIEGWRQVAAAVHARGSAFFLQLWHVGRIAHPDNMQHGLHPVAPSALAHPRTIVTRSGQQPRTRSALQKCRWASSWAVRSDASGRHRISSTSSSGVAARRSTSCLPGLAASSCCTPAITKLLERD